MICGIYKYVWHDEIVYIGKADKDIMSRIVAHKSESKFQPYLKDCVIWYTECVNPAHTTILETYLINKYKPRLNVSMKYTDNLPINLIEPEWRLISELLCEHKDKSNKKAHGNIWLKRRQNQIEYERKRIMAYKWMGELICSHCQEYSFEFVVPEWIWRDFWLCDISDCLDYSCINIYLDTKNYKVMIKTEWLGHWRHCCERLAKKIKRTVNGIKTIERQIRINEELKYEFKR